MKPTISIAIATFNEELNLSRCLRSVVGWVDEIIVVDGHSTDQTIKIAKKFNAKIISTTNKALFHINKQMAIDACTSDWILQLDADEIVTPNLKTEILTTLAKTDKNGFWLNRQNYFLGKFLTKGGQYPDPTLRLYRRGRGHLPCKSVHEQAVVKHPIGQLKHDLKHYADISFSRYLIRNNRYTSLLAQELRDQKLSFNFLNFTIFFIFKPIYWFFLTYFRHLGLLDGFPGLVFSWYSSLRFPISYIKYYELTKTDQNINLTKDWN